MSSIYRRPDSPFWWMKVQVSPGEWKPLSTKTTDEKKARELLRQVEKRMAAEKASGDEEAGPLTVARYGRRWLNAREKSGANSIRDDRGRFTKWVEKSELGPMLLSAVRPIHVRGFVKSLEAQQKTTETGKERALAPRSVLHVYGLLRILFADAVADELIGVTPCVLKARRKEVPRKQDKDATWRASAVFSRKEVEALISDERVPMDRRTLNALLFLSGERFSEVADTTWGHYDAEAEPLGRLTVASAFSVRKKESKETKTGAARYVPVHPTLAAVLAQWKLSGWAKMMGRPPTSKDWLIPSRIGQRRRVNHSLRRFHEDCERLGLRLRRQHDARRTFISLALGDGANAEILRWVTHDPPRDQFNQYFTPPWEALCSEVAKLRVSLPREGVTLELRSVVGMKNPPSLGNLEGEIERGVRDLNPSATEFPAASRALSPITSIGSPHELGETNPTVPGERNFVTQAFIARVEVLASGRVMEVSASSLRALLDAIEAELGGGQ
jgi:integrase